jgi:aquaporin Z
LWSLRHHWPEYLMEAWGLGTFMVSAGVFGTLLFHPASPVARAVPDPLALRALMGVLMGLTAVALIYSPWGRQSGAHLNPAVTLTFLRLGKVRPWDALFYVLAQAAGGTAGPSSASRPSPTSPPCRAGRARPWRCSPRP